MERTSAGAAFRWIGNDAEIVVQPPEDGEVLVLELEPGPGIASNQPVVQVFDKNDTKVAEWAVAERMTTELLLLPASDGGVQTLRLHTSNGGLPVAHDPRLLNFRVYRCDFPTAPVDRSIPTDHGPVLRRLIGTWRDSYNPAWLFKGPIALRRARRLLNSLGEDVFEAGMDHRLGAGWYRLEHAEAEKLRWVARNSQLRVRRADEPQNLAMLIEPGPSVGFEPFTLVARNRDGLTISTAEVRGLTYLEIPIPAPARHIATLHFEVEGGGPRSGTDPRDLSFRVLACGRRRTNDRSFDTATPEFGTALTVSSRPASKDWPAQNPRQIAGMGQPKFLHVHGCGDFILMAREHWLDVRGFAELDLSPSNLDALLCYAAHHSGAQEEILRDPLRVYHIAPTTEPVQQNMPAWSDKDLIELIAQMRTLHAPVIFNLEELEMAAS